MQIHPPFYNEEDVTNVWKDCIQYSVPFNNPAYDTTEDLYAQNMSSLKHKINQQRIKVTKGEFHLLPINFEMFHISSIKQREQLASMLGHEVRMFQKRHKRCYKCQGVSIIKDYTKLRYESDKYQCSSCRNLSISSFWKSKHDMLLPVWYDDNDNVQYHVPIELQNLRLGEQLLIQRLSCFVPIVHIKHGIMGIHGNCVCFRQDTAEVCNVLPRTRVNAVKIIRSYNNKEISGIQNYNIFVIRRDVVLRALRWLKKYHKWYRDDPDLVIQESNLDWMGESNEVQLLGIHAETSNIVNDTEYVSSMHEQDDIEQTGKSFFT